MQSIPYREQPLSEEFSSCPYGNRFVHLVEVRHGNFTSVRDVVLVSLHLTLFSSDCLRLNDNVLMIFL